MHSSLFHAIYNPFPYIHNCFVQKLLAMGLDTFPWTYKSAIKFHDGRVAIVSVSPNTRNNKSSNNNNKNKNNDNKINLLGVQIPSSTVRAHTHTHIRTRKLRDAFCPL